MASNDVGVGLPAISGIAPGRAPAPGGLPITISGTGFTDASEVHFGDFGAQAFSIVSDQEIRVIAPPAFPGTVQLTVTTPSGPSAPALFTFTSGKGRTLIFWVEILYLLILLALGALYFTSVRQIWKNDFGPVPLGVPWFAALGAVMIGLQGVIDHGADWDESYNFWHIARPLIGATFGVVVYLIIVAGIVATGTPKVQTGTATSPVDNIFYYIVAFIVGYREEIVRSLIQRVSDVIFAPGA
jgi:hypothetical protein